MVWPAGDNKPMRTRILLMITVLAVLALAACAPTPRAAVQTLVAALPAAPAAPLGGQVAALPTPDPSAATATPPPSSFALPTVAPTAIGPLATLTAISGLIPTMDLNATPYEVVYRGVPVFIEFQARW